jgi:hypothetical protein
MNSGTICGRLVKRLFGWDAGVKSFEHELQAGGGLGGRVDAGVCTVEVHKVVGSVGRAATLRSDFCHRRGPAMTARHYRVRQALREGKALPPLELYKLTGRPQAVRKSEYYVVDGHHRVAMARKLGQDYLDAHVVVYRLADASCDPPYALPLS